MVQKLKDIELHHLTKHTNVSIPGSKFITGTLYPKQNEELLDTVVEIKYRNMYIPDMDEYTGPDAYDPHTIYTAKCVVLRCDDEAPHVFVARSKDYRYIFVTNSLIWEDVVTIYPFQMNVVGIPCLNRYHADMNLRKAYVLRADNGEPCHTVLLEETDDGFRIILGDECISILNFDPEVEELPLDFYQSDQTIIDSSQHRKRIFEEQYTRLEALENGSVNI